MRRAMPTASFVWFVCFIVMNLSDVKVTNEEYQSILVFLNFLNKVKAGLAKTENNFVESSFSSV